MRIPSGSTDRKIYFVAVDATDLKTRETGLSSFTVVRSRDGAADVTYTTPTVAEIDAATMPGVYALTLDEDTSVAAGHDTEEYCVHITQASMAPVTRVIELYRVKFTEGQSATMANSAVDADVERWLGTVVATPTVGGVPEVDVTHAAGSAQASIATQASVDAVDNFVDTEIADIQARLPAALVGGRIAANAEVVGDKTGYALTAADKESIIAGVSGTADASTTVSFDDAARTEADVDYWRDAIVVFTAGPAAWQPRRIHAFDPTTDRITVQHAWTTAPGLNTYMILKTAVGGQLGSQRSDYVNVDRWSDEFVLPLNTFGHLQADVRAWKEVDPNALIAGRVDANIENGLTVTTRTLPGQAAPPAAPTLIQLLTWLYKVLRNRKTQTATLWSLMADDEATVDAKATVSDDGTTAIKQEIVSGP